MKSLLILLALIQQVYQQFSLLDITDSILFYPMSDTYELGYGMSSSAVLLENGFQSTYTTETTVISVDNTINKKVVSNSTDVFGLDQILVGVDLEGWSLQTRLDAYLAVDDFTYDVEKVVFVYKQIALINVTSIDNSTLELDTTPYETLTNNSFTTFSESYGELYISDLYYGAELTIEVEFNKWDLLDMAQEYVINSDQIWSIEMGYREQWDQFGEAEYLGNFSVFLDEKGVSYTCTVSAKGVDISYSEKNCDLDAVELLIETFNETTTFTGYEFAIGLTPMTSLQIVEDVCTAQSFDDCSYYELYSMSTGEIRCMECQIGLLAMQTSLNNLAWYYEDYVSDDLSSISEKLDEIDELEGACPAILIQQIDELEEDILTDIQFVLPQVNWKVLKECFSYGLNFTFLCVIGCVCFFKCGGTCPKCCHLKTCKKNKLCKKCPCLLSCFTYLTCQCFITAPHLEPFLKFKSSRTFVCCLFLKKNKLKKDERLNEKSICNMICCLNEKMDVKINKEIDNSALKKFLGCWCCLRQQKVNLEDDEVDQTYVCCLKHPPRRWTCCKRRLRMEPKIHWNEEQKKNVVIGPSWLGLYMDDQIEHGDTKENFVFNHATFMKDGQEITAITLEENFASLDEIGLESFGPEGFNFNNDDAQDLIKDCQFSFKWITDDEGVSRRILILEKKMPAFVQPTNFNFSDELEEPAQFKLTQIGSDDDKVTLLSLDIQKKEEKQEKQDKEKNEEKKNEEEKKEEEKKEE